MASYHAVKAADGTPVLLLSPASERPSQNDVVELAHEHYILTRLADAPIAHAVDHMVVGARPWLVLEEVDAQPLNEVAARHRAPDHAIAMGISIARALGAVHRAGVIHQQLGPHHVLVLSDGSVRLTGFGGASERHREAPSRLFAGKLQYMAPEQTGRMNRAVDFRADLYALGVVLYELVVGVPPLQAPDTLGWIHAHMALVPSPPHAMDVRVPPSLSAILLKLLAKSPADRYQSTEGLVRDLERCASAILLGDGHPFPTGRDDFPHEFRVSQRLHGRDREIAQLAEGLARAISSGSSVVSLVPGYSGIGKTSLVGSLYQPLARLRGRFISGKFDQYKRDIPYATIVQAFRGLLRDVLAASEDALTDWCARLRDAMGNNAQVLADVIPEVALLLGASAPVAEVGPTEAQNRLESVFLAFVRVFARREHPLVVFLDDMQWADHATLGLLRALAAPSAVPSLHLVLAYRDNEVDAGHPLELTVEALRTHGVTIDTIPVRALELAQVVSLVAESTKRDASDADVRSLASALHVKTGGNPFFIGEILQQLDRSGLLVFDAGLGGWRWDARASDAVEVAGSVVDLLVLRLSALPELTRRALALAACFGNRFDLDALVAILDVPLQAVAAALSGPREDGFIVAVTDAARGGAFRFHHDRIQQAAYSLFSADERTRAHLEIGRFFRGRLAAGATDDLLFHTVEHSNRALSIVDAPAERAELSALNLAAGRRAKSSAAWAPARTFFETAVALGADDAWQNDRDRTFSAVLSLAECEFLTGRFSPAMQHFDDLRRRSCSRAESAGVVTLQVRLLIVAGRYDDALALAASELVLFGEAFPTEPSEIERSVASAQRRLSGFDVGAMRSLPRVTDPSPRALIDLLASLPPAIYSRTPTSFPLLAMRMVLLSLQHGNCEASCFGYSMYAMVLAASLDQPARALELSEASIALNDELDDARWRAPALHIHANHIIIWRRGYDAALPFLERAYDAAMNAGDMIIAAYVTFMGAWQEVERGKPLEHLRASLARHHERAGESRHATARDVVRLQMQYIRALLLDTLDRARLSSVDFDADAARQRIAAAGFDTGLVIHDALSVMLAWMNGRIEDAEAVLVRGRANIGSAYALPVLTTWALFDALTAAALFDDAPADERAALTARVDDAEARLRQWAADCPENFEAKHALVAAEAARLAGRSLDAQRNCEHAFAAARRTGALPLQAIAAQLAARIALANGLAHSGRTWLVEQHAALREWGAISLSTRLEAAHPYLRGASSDGTATAQIDALAAIKASQALSRELNVEDLALTLLRVVIGNTGAQRALLFLVKDGGLTLAATTDPSTPSPGGGLPDPDAVPVSVLNYVERARRPIVLADITADPTFSSDPYVERAAPRSVLCSPVLVGTELVGVLYLEHSLIADAFSSDCIALLEIVSTQLAISLENARLQDERRSSEAEAARREAAGASDARYRDVIETMSDGFLGIDREWRVVAVNHVQERVSGKPRTETLGKILWDVFPDARDPARRFWSEFHRVAEERQPSHFVEHYPPLDLWVEVDAIPSRDGGIAVFFRDISERKRAEARQQELLARELEARGLAEASGRAKDEFLAMLGHELRNPLAPIVTALQLMRLRGEGPERERAIIERQVKHLVRLVDDLLDVSRIAGGKIDLARERVELSTLLAVAIERTSPLLEQARHTLEVEVEPRGLAIDADPARMSQVFSNLLANAAKYTPPGGHIVIRAARAGNDVVVTVEDSGVGIPADLLPRVFDLFVQNAQTIERAQGGLGLGLSIVKRLVELHQGTVEARSTGDGHGSTFTVRVPRALGEILTESPPSIARFPSGEELAILIVDDNEDAAEVLSIALEQMGHRTLVATDGPAALALLRSGSWIPDVALLDIGLPVMDGYELAGRLRDDPSLVGVRLVAITGYGQASDRRRAEQAGFDHHLVKPVDLATLEGVLLAHPRRVRS